VRLAKPNPIAAKSSDRARKLTTKSNDGPMNIAGVIDVRSGRVCTITPGSKMGSSSTTSPFGKNTLETPTVEMFTIALPVSIARSLARAACWKVSSLRPKSAFIGLGQD
jgi:hypothetical protein